MKFTCLSEGKGYYFPPCHILNICGFRVLLDCPLDLSALAVFSPLPIAISSLLDEETSSQSSEFLDSKSLIQAEPWYKTVTSLQLWSIYSIDLVPIYFVSSAAEELLNFSNIIPEWLSGQRQERFYSAKPLFNHIQLLNEKKLMVSPAIHSSKFLTSWQEPCIVFCPHWSLRLGPVVHLLQHWCADPNSLLIMEEGADINLAFLPFKPMLMKVLPCSFISGIKLNKAIPLLKILQPKHVLVPESLSPHIRCWNPKFSVRYFSENETVAMPKLKNYADMDIATDLYSKLRKETKLIQKKDIARLKGELLIEHGKCRLVLGNKQVLSSQDRALLFLGRVELNSLLMALQKMGMKATAQHTQSTDGSENMSIVCISEPNEALIVVTSTRTMISVVDETTASLVSEAVRSTSGFI